MEALKVAVRRYAAAHANADGLAVTPVPGLRMMCVEAPRDNLHTLYRPLVCMVLSGAKNVVIGTQERVFTAGHSFIISADMPVAGRIVEASREAPFIAVTVEFDMPILAEVGLGDHAPEPEDVSTRYTLFEQDNDALVIDCAARLLRLVDVPHIIPVLRPGIMRELHFWLLSGRHGAALRALAPLDSNGNRLIRAIAELRANYRQPISVGHLARVAAMGATAFHKHFKQATSLTPGQFQKHLRLIEARRLILDQGLIASRAGFDVGYKSLSQFTREYGRFHGRTPGSSR